MKTGELIDFLATQIGHVDRTAIGRRFAVAFTLSVLGALALMRAVLGIRNDLPAVIQTSIFWGKVSFPVVVAVGSMLVLQRLGSPGSRVRRLWIFVASPFAAVWISGAVSITIAAAGSRLPLLFGQTWRVCAPCIWLLTTTTFPVAFWVAKQLAPTQLCLTGATAGLLASSMAAAVYCMHCPEMSSTFWAVWYVVGMLIPAGLGACLGPYLSRW